MARGVEAPRFRDVGEDAALEDDTGLDTLTHHPGEVGGRVDAYRGKFGARVAVLW